MTNSNYHLNIPVYQPAPQPAPVYSEPAATFSETDGYEYKKPSVAF